MRQVHGDEGIVQSNGEAELRLLEQLSAIDVGQVPVFAKGECESIRLRHDEDTLGLGSHHTPEVKRADDIWSESCETRTMGYEL
jgi:hypothetical protein